jgi:hypothetical protein
MPVMSNKKMETSNYNRPRPQSVVWLLLLLLIIMKMMMVTAVIDFNHKK